MLKQWQVAFFDVRDIDTTNPMAAMAREQLLACSEITKEEIAVLSRHAPTIKSTPAVYALLFLIRTLLGAVELI